MRRVACLTLSSLVLQLHPSASAYPLYRLHIGGCRQKCCYNPLLQSRTVGTKTISFKAGVNSHLVWRTPSCCTIATLQTKPTVSGVCVSWPPSLTAAVVVTLMCRQGRGGGPGGAYMMHVRCLKTTDPRISTVPGRSTSGFHLPGRRCLHQARSEVGCSASRMGGELRPTKNRSRGRLQHLVHTF